MRKGLILPSAIRLSMIRLARPWLLQAVSSSPQPCWRYRTGYRWSGPCRSQAACTRRRGVRCWCSSKGRESAALAVGNVLEGVEVLVVSGDFDAAFPPRRTVEVQGAGIVEGPPINREMVVVKAFVQRPGDTRPDTVLAFRRGRSRPRSRPGSRGRFGPGAPRCGIGRSPGS
jgi:hypothetical protein